jgi:hypothetical protein
MKLHDFIGQLASKSWQLGALKGASCDHNISGLHQHAVCPDHVARTAGLLIDRCYPHSKMNRKLKAVDIPFKSRDYLIPRHESLGRIALIFCAWKAKGPVWG